MLKIFSLLFFLVFNSLSAEKWDNEFWQFLSLDQWESDKHKLYLNTEVRFNYDYSKFYYFRLTQNYAYQLLSDVTMEAHLALLHTKSRGALEFTNRQRLELEMNPFFEFDHFTVRLRNRLELLRIEGHPPIQFLFRQRTAFVFPLENWGKLTQIGFSNELFYDYNISKFIQNRFVPLELTFKVQQEVNFSIYLMIRDFLSSSQWHKSLVLGSGLSF